MPLPTRRALLILAALSPVALLGYVWPAALDVLAGLDLLVLLLVIADAGRAVPLTDVSVARHAPNSFSLGRLTHGTYVWHNDGIREARLEVREVRPFKLGGTQAPGMVTVRAHDSTSVPFDIRPQSRGQEECGWFAIRTYGPFGLGYRRGRLSLPWHVVVYPALPAARLKASVAEAVRRAQQGRTGTRHLGEGRQFESLREWVPGDDVRRIDWKATARRRKVITRQYEEERRQQVMLVVDAGRLQVAEYGGIPRIDYIINAAIWMGLAAIYHDDNVGLMTFAEEVREYIPPQKGKRGLRAIVDALTVTEPTLLEPDYPAAFRYLAIRNRKRSLTVLFTDVIDRTASNALLANLRSLRPRHVPLVVTIRNPDLEEAASLPVTDASSAYRRAAAEELLRARSEALWEMRRSGAVVLDVPPDRSAPAVVDQYLSLKARGRI